STGGPGADAGRLSTASAMALARVAASESRWDPATRRIFTVITLDVRDRLKGEIPLGPLTIRQLGGRVAGMQAWGEGSPEFTVGERGLGFLSRNAEGTLRGAHPSQGQLSLGTGGGVGIPMRVNGSEPVAPTSGLGQVRDGYGAWNAVAGSALRYVDGGSTDARGFAFDGVNTISFGDPLGQLDPPTNCTGTLGLGGYFRDDTQTRV